MDNIVLGAFVVSVIVALLIVKALWALFLSGRYIESRAHRSLKNAIESARSVQIDINELVTPKEPRHG